MSRLLTGHDMEVRLQLQSRAFEGIFDLLRSLGSTLELDKVAKLSLLTVVGQLRVERVALYLPSGGRSRFRLLKSVGVEGVDLPGSIENTEAMEAVLSAQAGTVDIDPWWDMPEEIRRQFEYAAYLRDSTRPVALLLSLLHI